MKKYLLFFVFSLSLSNLSAQIDYSKFVCRYGFTAEISTQRSWGFDKPVVLSVVPNSSADAAGLRPNDIIEKIDGVSTSEGCYDQEVVLALLHGSDTRQMVLEVSNLSEEKRNITLNSYCTLKGVLTEKDLADVYSFYSVEDVQKRQFSCPFKIKGNAGADLLNYKTFAFPEVDPANKELDEILNFQIRKALEEKGLTESIVDPDLIIHTYYSYKNNPKYSPNVNTDQLPLEARYNPSTRSWETLPIYMNPLIPPSRAQFLLKFGIRLIDPKKSADEKLFVVWELEANELLKSNYPLQQYAQFHIPLMMMNYPYIRLAENPSYYYSKTRYNYTGINFNMINLGQIVYVDYLSPAENEGIQIGDKIEKINGIVFDNDLKSADAKYTQFILQTEPLRDSKTKFTDAEGFSNCMYWDKLKYVQISEELKKPEFSAMFSYLFFFEPYVNLSGSNFVHFELNRNGNRETVRVKPIIVEEEIFETRY
ncbi:DUF4136 domain-containing protein [Bacteroidales bacterium OttesenSCG-928-A17]|nr:DUF4136 domain-containing protein [Bacteroidales bacterium OttesenSCG-928-A17]